MPPIALGVQVAEVEAVLQAELDGCNGSRDLTGHEGFAADRTFVVEQDSIRSMDAVGLPVVHRDPVGIELGGSVGRPRIEWRLLILWYLLRLAIEFRCGSLVEPRAFLQLENPDRLKNTQSSKGIGVGGRSEERRVGKECVSKWKS